MSTNTIRTQFCPECATAGVVAYPDAASGRVFLEPMPAPTAGNVPGQRCYLVQPDPELGGQLLASELRPAQIPGAREHEQRFYCEHTRVACYRARQRALSTA